MTLMTNESLIDRIVRVGLGVGLAVLLLAGVVAAPLLYVAWVVAAIALVTGIVGFCPLYALLRISTKRATH
jgi:hypothetical protein